jgi:hypothetical protein
MVFVLLNIELRSILYLVSSACTGLVTVGGVIIDYWLK